MKELNEDFVDRELARVQVKIRNANDAQRLRKELRSLLGERYSELFNRVARRKAATVRTIFAKGDGLMIKPESATNPMLLIIANAGGEDALSTFASFAFLNSLTEIKSPLTIIPRVSRSLWDGPVTATPSQKLLAFCSKEDVDILVAIRDGFPYLDGFYVTIPNQMRKDNFAEELVDYVEKQGHTVGKYSLREDYPTYSVLTSDNPLMLRLVRNGISVYGFTIGDDMNAAKDALERLRLLHSSTFG